MPTLVRPVPPRGHPASFQSPSWLARPASLLVRTHPYQPFLLAPVPSRLRRRTARPRPSYLRALQYELLLPPDVEDTDLGRNCVPCGQGLVCQICEMPGCLAHSSRPIYVPQSPGPVPVPGPKSAALLISHHRRAAGPTTKGTTCLAMD